MSLAPPKLAVETTFRRLAIEAGAAIMEIYGQDDFGVEAKGDDSPVTKADLAADEIIRRGLSAAYPDVQLVTEEMASTHGGAREDRFILVDPLDGTKEFVKRGGDFTVNIALIEKGAPVAGVVFAPAKGRLFQTLDDGGAAEETGDFETGSVGPRKPIKVASPDNDGLRVVASASHRDQATDDYIARYKVGAFKSAGSSLKFCLVATGEADLYPRLGRTMEWDTGAGHAVLKAAGGEVVRFDDPATPLAYGKPGDDNPHFIAYAPGVALV
ncbi:MAG: 3'(2'),5'-bisphosphate nucleotidase CysQ [Pseudomonadota bacterium]